jgi:hypothetical protein
MYKEKSWGENKTSRDHVVVESALIMNYLLFYKTRYNNKNLIF